MVELKIPIVGINHRFTFNTFILGERINNCMKIRDLPHYDILNMLFEISETSPSMIIWKAPKRKNMIGKVAGYKSKNIHKCYWTVTIYDTPYMVHRVVYSMVNKYILTNELIDHIDGDSLNNHPDNLRLCNNQQNRRNSRKHKTTCSIYKGVQKVPNKNKWVSHICAKHIGTYDSEIKAAIAYNQAAFIMFGEFASYNILF